MRMTCDLDFRVMDIKSISISLICNVESVMYYLCIYYIMACECCYIWIFSRRWLIKTSLRQTCVYVQHLVGLYTPEVATRCLPFKNCFITHNLSLNSFIDFLLVYQRY